jgi:hypothetical protein
MPSPFSPQRAAARWFAGKLPESDWPATARDALEAGFDGTALRRLAAFEQSDHWDVVNYIEPVLGEMGAQSMSLEEALLWTAKDICCDIVEGSRDPFDGAAEISQDILRTLVFPKDLMPIFEEVEMFGTGFFAGGEADARKRIFSHVRTLLSQEDAPNQQIPDESAFQFFEIRSEDSCHHCRS